MPKRERETPMKTMVAALSTLLAVTSSGLAQDHLIPDASAFVDPDEYELKLRHVFGQAFDGGVILRALILPSFKLEYAVGIKVVGDRAEVFVIEPSSIIWDTKLIRMIEIGEIKQFGRDGKIMPLEQNETLNVLKKRTPADYRSIKVTRKAKSLPKELGDEIRDLWEKMLMDIRRSTEGVLDVVTYHFSAFFEGHGEISGHVSSPAVESKTGRLVTLAETLADFARAKAELTNVKAKLDAARKSMGN
jgi:hypothetical protein